MTDTRWARRLLVTALICFSGAAQAGRGHFDYNDACIPESGGYSGSLRVEYMMVRSGDQNASLPTMVMVVTEREFAQLARKLRCNDDASGLVLIKDVEWEAQLSLAPSGKRMHGRLLRNNQRVIVVTRKYAGKLY